MPVLAGLFGGKIGGVDDGIVIFFIGLAIFSLQFFCCWKWDNILVRLLPSIATLGYAIVFFVMATRVQNPGQAEECWKQIVYAGIMLGTTILGWIVWGIFCLCHSRVSRNPDGY